jgi:signal transduction histidine kinase
MAKANQGSGAEETSLATYKQIVATVVHASAVGLAEILKKYKDEEERKNLIRTYVDKIRFYPDQTGYFYVYTFECMNIALPGFKQLQGKNLYDHQDSHGKYSIRELSAAAKKGGGFVEYYWAKPGSVVEQKKIGYAEPIPGTDYFIGSGVYTGE